MRGWRSICSPATFGPRHEGAVRDESGRLLSRTAVSELGEQLWANNGISRRATFGEYEIVYLVARGIAGRIRPGQRREPVMAANGFTATGDKVLLDLMAGSKEDAETVTAFREEEAVVTARQAQRRQTTTQSGRNAFNRTRLGPDAANMFVDVWRAMRPRLQGLLQRGTLQ